MGGGPYKGQGIKRLIPHRGTILPKAEKSSVEGNIFSSRKEGTCPGVTERGSEEGEATGT